MGVAPLTITPSDPLATILLTVPTSLYSAGLEVCSGGRNISIRRHNNDSTEPEVKPATHPLWVNQQAKKGVTVLAAVTDPDCQAQTGQLFNNEDKKENVWDTRNL